MSIVPQTNNTYRYSNITGLNVDSLVPITNQIVQVKINIKSDFQLNDISNNCVPDIDNAYSTEALASASPDTETIE